jgi:hypothetical protein
MADRCLNHEFLKRAAGALDSEPGGPGFNPQSQDQVFHATASRACCT